mgnify:FL=1
MGAFSEKSRGFTLYELLIVMAILSIMGTMGTVSLLGFKQRSQLSGMANILKADLNRGKILAAKHKSYVVLQIHETSYEMFLDNGAGEATSGDWVREGKELQVAKRDLAPSLSIDSNFPSDHLRLRGSGRIRPGTIIVQSRSGKHIKLVINAVGRIRLVDGVS